MVSNNNAPENLLGKLRELDAQYAGISNQLLDPEVLADHRRVRALAKKRAALEPIINDYRAHSGALEQLKELQTIINHDADPQLVELAREELPALEARTGQLLDAVQKRLVTADDQAVGSIILEVRAGVGGDEAAIWAGDLLNMYRRFAAEKGWQVEDIQFSTGPAGPECGYKLAILRISGNAVWAQLGYEGGTHQVKRVPVTEAQGRVHTSTATVAVLPEPEDVQINLDPKDVKEMITTAQGPGGQNVNKVATAVHLIHRPTGLEVRIQDTKSQSQNREKAWQVLRARLYEQQKSQADSERAEARSTMIGSAGRAEKIRTYRYKESLVVDHRIRKSCNLGDIMAGHLQPLIDDLIEQDTAQRLAAL